MEKGELEVTLNYSDLAAWFEESKQHCEMCRFIQQKIKTRFEEAGVQSVWDGKIERRKEQRRLNNETTIS